MGNCLRLISFSATQPNTGAAAAAVSGDSLQIENAQAQVLTAWGFNQVEGWMQFFTNSTHDAVRGFRPVVEALQPTVRKYPGTAFRFQAQETVNAQIAGSNTAGDVELGSMLLWYDNLPGINFNGITASQLKKQAIIDTTVYATITGSGAGYSGSEGIQAETQLLKANRNYAVLGIMTETPCAAVWMNGTDFGNARIGVPGDAVNTDITGGFFPMLSRAYDDLPCVPVFNVGNAGNTNIGILMNENAGSSIVSVQLALLDR